MKKYIKIIYKIIILIVVTSFLVIAFSILFNEDKNIRTRFSSIPKNSMDIVFLGSSHVQYGINPAVINEFTGLYSYINGTPCQPIEVSYEILKETLKYQNPKLIVLDVFTLLPSRSVCMADSIYKMAADEMTGIEKYNTLMHVSDKKLAYNYIFSLRMHHQNWSSMDLSDVKFNFNKLNYEDFGYVNLNSKDLNFRYLPEKQREEVILLDDHSIKYIKKIKSLLDRKNIDLLLIKTPFDIDQENYDKLMSVWDFAEKENIKYLDLLSSCKDMDFAFGVDSETWHNTNWGAYKNSLYLSEYINDNYSFNHKENIEINKNMAYLSDVTLFNLLENMVDPYRFIDYSSKFDSISVIKYDGNIKSSITKNENEILNSLGLNYNFIWNKNLDYYAIVKNGKLLVDGNNKIKEVINGKEIEVSKKGIKFNGEFIDGVDGELSVVVFNNNLTWHQIMNIDYSSKWFWKKGCIDWKCK